MPTELNNDAPLQRFQIEVLDRYGACVSSNRFAPDKLSATELTVICPRAMIAITCRFQQ
ncbi:hypothetical protein BN938_0124 [Mucinivorans hirudinis]|uniref:Uncharacterized protein n=1 Tax=Mucinivorans hirudinis TaxID=1433126 RepID=A0A060R5R7_9BACT|nr:hypothetical protein BN938_0124 [Mucinivorans hirudinis]